MKKYFFGLLALVFILLSGNALYEYFGFASVILYKLGMILFVVIMLGGIIFIVDKAIDKDMER